MRRSLAMLLAACGGLGVSVGQAQDSGDPDLDFLEYLGSWQEDDEEWVVVAEWEPDARAPGDAKPEAERDDDDE